MKQEITIVLNHGPVVVGAHVVGDWAYHKYVGDSLNTDKWTVAHVPTGYGVGRKYSQLSYHVAKRFAHRLSRVTAEWSGGSFMPHEFEEEVYRALCELTEAKR